MIFFIKVRANIGPKPSISVHSFIYRMHRIYFNMPEITGSNDYKLLQRLGPGIDKAKTGPGNVWVRSVEKGEGG